MKKRIASLLVAGMVGMAMLFAGGCCHMHHHDCNKPSCCERSSCCNKPCCNKPSCCDKAAGSDKPCCNKQPTECPKAEPKK